ncbi:MAG: heme exporter protein CcmB [Pseudohongiellaceae bacterium]
MHKPSTTAPATTSETNSAPTLVTRATPVTTSAAFLATLRRDLTVALRRKHDVLNPFMFFLIVATLFPIGISPEPTRLAEIAAGVLWIAALLAAMLSMDNLFRADYEDGSLEQLLLSPHPLFFLVLAKNISHWIVSGLPVVLVSPLIAYMLNLPPQSYPALLLTLALGTPALSLLGSIGVALTVGLGSRGLILAVITLPMCIPILIAGTLAVQQTQNGASLIGYLAIMAAMLIAALSLAPLASAAALRISVS